MPGIGNGEKEKGAFDQLMKLAQKGDTDAQCKVGQEYLKRKKLEEALFWLRKSSRQGFARAGFVLGSIYEAGQQVPIDAVRALHYYSLSAVQGNCDGQKKLADFYVKGLALEKSEENGLYWYQQAAERGNTRAAACAARIYENRGDQKNALRLYETAIQYDTKDGEICLKAGRLCLYGEKEIPKEEWKGIEYLKRAVSLNSIPAMMILAEYYESEGRPEDAYQYYERAQKGGLAAAMRKAADYRFKGLGCMADKEKAVALYKGAAEKGDGEANYKMAIWYLEGTLFPKDPEIGMRYLKKAAYMNHGDAAYLLAKHYKEGGDGNEALKYFHISEKAGIFRACHMLGELYLNGAGTGRPNLSEAIKWKEKYVSWDPSKYEMTEEDRKNQEEDWAFLGDCYYEGKHFSKNYGKALECYRHVQRETLGDVRFRMGEIYRQGGYGVEVNNARAKECYRISAIQENMDACFRLAELLDGDASKSTQGANGILQLYETVIEDGTSPWTAAALRNAAAIYANSSGNLRDDQKAFQYSKMAVEMGDRKALEALALAYYRGMGTDRDYEKAFQFFREAAEDGNSRVSQYFLGRMYEKGQIADKNEQRALEWYLRAAEANEPRAAYQTGKYLYEQWKKQKQERDLLEAMRYIRISADAANEFQYQACDILCQIYCFDINETLIGQDSPYAAKAFPYAKNAFENGEKTFSAYVLGYIYFYGSEEIYGKKLEGTPQKTYLCLKNAADAGNYEAMKLLGDLQRSGSLPPVPKSEITCWYERILKESPSRPLVVSVHKALGDLYYGGCKGCSESVYDLDRSFRHYLEALEILEKKEKDRVLMMCYERGDRLRYIGKIEKIIRQEASLGKPEAMYLMGLACEKGLGVEKNKELAKKWFQNARKLGHKESEKKLNSFPKRLWK